jgi:hypothetical protein
MTDRRSNRKNPRLELRLWVCCKENQALKLLLNRVHLFMDFIPGNNFHYSYFKLQWPSQNKGPLLWSSGQSSWLQIQRSGFNTRRYQIFWEVVGLEWGPLSLVSTNEELLGRKNSDTGLEIRDYSRRDPSHWQRGTLISAEVGTNFADKRQLLGQYSWLVD